MTSRPAAWRSGGASTLRSRAARGQATVELIGVLPLVLLIALVLLQVALVARDQVLVLHAAREGARAAAVDPTPTAAREAAIAGSGLAPDRVGVSTTGQTPSNQHVSVTVMYRSGTDLPVVGALVGDVKLRGSATMRVEY